MIRKRIKTFVLATVVAVGLLGSTVTAYAEDGDMFNYLDAWNGIHGNDYKATTDNGIKEFVADAEIPQNEADGMDISLQKSEDDVSARKADGNDPTGDSKEIGEKLLVEERFVLGNEDVTGNNNWKDSVSGSGSSQKEDTGNSIGDYISSDVTIGQTGTPDLNIDFSMNGGNNNNTGLFTPDGNLTLVDDLDAQESASLQYLTVQTKNGTTFYIIIDRTADKENVYFLNPVDAADLMALMDDDTKAKFQTDTEAQANSNTQNTETTEKTDDISTQKDDTGEKKENSTNPLGTLLIFIILGGGGAAAYYFFKIKPQKTQKRNDDDDLEFQDDEEYDMENPERDKEGNIASRQDGDMNEEEDSDSDEEDY